MPAIPEANLNRDTPLSKCLARSVLEVFAEDPSLEAVTIDPSRQTISIATLGKIQLPQVTDRVQQTIKRTQETTGGGACTLLAGTGDCGTCVQPLSDQERQRITIRHEGGATTIARVTCPTAPSFWRWRDLPLPRMVPREVEFFEHEHETGEWKAQLAAAIFCGIFGLSGYLFGSQPLSIPAYLLAYLTGSWFTVHEVWERWQKRAVDIHFLMLAVAAGSACIGAWGEGAMLLFLFSLSSALEHFALGRTEREIRSLFREAPKFATLVDEHGQETSIDVGKIERGMRLLVKPGEQFPVDAEVTQGHSAADESNLTGEAAPVEKTIGDTILAGTMNMWGAVQATVLRPASQSALQKIIHLIKEAQHQKAPAQQFTDRFGTYYTYLVLALSGMMFFVWWLLMRDAPFAGHGAFYKTMTLLVVASPCALVLSIPSAVLAAIAWSARHGILFRGGAAVEKLASVTIVALDKTGTLTTGELRVETIESFPAGREREVAELAYSMEKLSAHPLARAITRYGKQQDLRAEQLEKFESITGQGLQARRGGNECLLGRRDWLARGTRAALIEDTRPADAGFSELWVAHGTLLGRIVLRDDIRPQARQVLQELRKEGLTCVVLTGDRRNSGEHLRAELNIEDVRAELTPEQKLAVIRTLTSEGERVAMVGDGVNDAPSLAAAHIGVAMGARGSDAALEQADVVLMHDRIENFLAAFRLSQRARRIIRQNLFISLGTVAVLVSFAMAGKIPLTLGVVGHEGSTVIVVMNSLRLLLGGSRRKDQP